MYKKINRPAWRIFKTSIFILFALTIFVLSCRKIAKETSLDVGLSSAMTIGSLSKLTVSTITTPATLDGTNIKENTTDGNLTTQWSGQNDVSGSQTIIFNLGSFKNVGSIKIAFVIGGSSTRTSSFDVAVSKDGLTGWVTALQKQNSTPNTTAFQTFDFGDVDGQYVRIIGYGNSTGNGWNSYSEVEIYGYTLLSSTSIKLPVTGGYVTSPAAVDPPNLTYNVVDGNLNTRWSGLSDSAGSPQFLSINLGATDTVDFVKIAFATGGSPTRTSLFSVSTSLDSVTWTSVVPKSRSTAGNTALEIFDFVDLEGKFIRIIGYGNTSSNWNSFSEVEIWGRAVGKVTTIADWETGNRSQWYGYIAANEATQLAVVSTNARQGTYAAKFTTHPGDSTDHGNEHNEVGLWADNGSGYTQERIDEDWYYGWSTLFPSDWVRPNSNPVNTWGIISQWHARNDSYPPINFNAVGDSLLLTLNTGTIDTSRWSDGTLRWLFTHVSSSVVLSSLHKGLWNDFIIHIRFRPDSTGAIEIWHRPQNQDRLVQIFSKLDIPTMQWCSALKNFNHHDPTGSDAYPKDNVNGWAAWSYFRQGLYRKGETINTNVIYHDNFIRGTTYSAIRARMR